MCIVCADILPHILLHSLDILHVLNNRGADVDSEIDIVVVAFHNIARIPSILVMLLALLKRPSNDGIQIMEGFLRRADRAWCWFLRFRLCCMG